MRRLLTTALFLSTAACAVAATYTVNPQGTGDFATIQAAIDSVLGGDVILLTDGTFTGVGNRDVDFRGKEVAVRSASGDPYACAIDCQQLGRGFRFTSGEGPGARLEGVTIANGRPSPYGDGGAILCTGGAMPVIRRCRLLENRAELGGGLRIDHASPHIEDCLFVRNRATYGGGAGMDASSSSAVVRRCYFLQNTGGCGGGARCCHGTAGMMFEDCWFALNSAQFNGGGAVAHAGVSFVGCMFRHNEAYEDGGGISFREGGNLVSGCTFYANACYGPSGGGIAALGDITIENTIVSHSITGCGLMVYSGSFQVSCCDIFNNAGGDWVGPIAGLLGIQGNICEDPQYCDPEAGDLHLHALSPCAPSNPECGLIGSLPVGCGTTPVDRVSWGEIKTMFRAVEGGK